MIVREEYLEVLKSFQNKPVIKVVTGVRRCGKSTLFQLFQNYLFDQKIKKNQIISINLESVENDYLLDYKELYNHVKKSLHKSLMSYVFIDEVQNCPQFERAINSLLLLDNIDIYITGSNAHMLSGELATHLAGRFITIDMLPFSFREYCASTQEIDLAKDVKFNNYIKHGAFPYIAVHAKEAQEINTYLEGIYSTILLKDIAGRAGISDINLLESIIKTLATSVGSPISTKKIADTITSTGRKTSVNTIDMYLRALTDSFIFYKVDRYDIKGRQYLKTLGKYYIVDTGIRNLILTSASSDIGHLIENLVYFELLRRGYKVNIGKVDDNEVDFVAQKSNTTLYVQVAASVIDEQTLKRELTSFDKIKDHNEKILITLDRIGANISHNGIMQYNLVDWLMS